MEFSVHKLQKAKLGVHIVQAILIVVSWIMDIVVFRNASIDGRVGWHFGLCFITVIPLIYLTMTPRFPKTRKYANPYALAAVDVVFAILWLSAFASVTNWNANGKCKPVCEDADASKCEAGICHVSKAVSGLGFLIWLLWCLTAAMSVYGLIYFRREGYLPGGSRAPTNAHMIDPDKEAFSTAPHDDEYAPIHGNDEHELGGSLGRRDHSPDRFAAPSEVPSYNAPSYNTGSYIPPHVQDEPTGYTGYSNSGNDANTGRAQFPSGRYDNL